MSTGIDYSKWDKMVAEMSSSEEDNDYQYADQQSNEPNTSHSNISEHAPELSNKHAKVTRLNQPSSVTIGPQGLTINPSKPNAKPNIPNTDSSNTVSLHQTNKQIQNTESKMQWQSVSVSLSSLLKKWTHNGGIHNFDYLWSQTADELVVRFLVPMTTRAKQVKIGFNANKKHFSCDISTTDGKQWVLHKTFSRKLKESVEEDAKLDWELCNVEIFNFDQPKLEQTMKDILGVQKTENKNVFIEYANRLSNCRLMKIVLEKEKISNRVIEWWESVFENDTKIDLKERIKDRKSDANEMNEIWKKAHAQFKSKVANHRPEDIYVPDDD